MSNGILDEMARQSQGMSPEKFICATCTKYEGALKCRIGVFIAFKGANMTGCWYYELGRKCLHCGKMT